MTVTLGLVGAGRRAESLADALTAGEQVKFAGAWSHQSDAARGLAERHEVPAFEKYDDLVDTCQGVVFAVTPAAQGDLAPVAARRGCAVLLGLPVAPDRAGVEQVVIAVGAGHAVSALGLVWRAAAEVRDFLETVESLSPRGGTGLVVVGRPAVGAAGGVWRLERPVLWGMGPHLIDLLEAALGPVPELRAHGDRSGWVGLHLEHQVGRFSDATLYVTGAEQRSRAIVEAFGPAGSARVDAAEAVGPQAYRTMVEDFAAAVAKGRSSDADVEHGLHLHDLVEAADDDLLRGR